MTMLVCSKCGCTAEYHQALAAGWLHAQRQGKPEGYLVVRCPAHITGHALKLAGLPQKKTSSRVADNLGRGLWAETDGAEIVSVGEAETDDGIVYVMNFHRSTRSMPERNQGKVFETIEALIQAMRKIQPDLRKWRLCEAL